MHDEKYPQHEEESPLGAGSPPPSSDRPDGSSGSDVGDESGPMMPASRGEAGSAVQGKVGSESAGEQVASPSFGRQVAQLVVIPAGIAIASVLVFLMFGFFAAEPDNIEDHLARLKESSGYGRELPGGMQDPRYKDRWLAAMNVARLIETIDEPERREAISDQLVGILNKNVAPEEDLLIHYLLIAIGRLGQPDAFEELTDRLTAERPQVRSGAVNGILSWPDDQRAQARLAVPALARLMDDRYDLVRANAARALWKLAEPGDAGVAEALREAMGGAGRDPDNNTFRQSRWQAAIALAALGDQQASQFVVDTLLNREALSQMPADDSPTGGPRNMTDDQQEQVMAFTLVLVPKMESESVWEHVAWLSRNDPSVVIRKAAIKLLESRAEEGE